VERNTISLAARHGAIHFIVVGANMFPGGLKKIGLETIFVFFEALYYTACLSAII